MKLTSTDLLSLGRKWQRLIVWLPNWIRLPLVFINEGVPNLASQATTVCDGLTVKTKIISYFYGLWKMVKIGVLVISLVQFGKILIVVYVVIMVASLLDLLQKLVLNKCFQQQCSILYTHTLRLGPGLWNILALIPFSCVMQYSLQLYIM